MYIYMYMYNMYIYITYVDYMWVLDMVYNSM